MTKGTVCSLRSAMIEDAIAKEPITMSSTSSSRLPAERQQGLPMPTRPSASSIPAT